jgi:hypothetical protein
MEKSEWKGQGAREKGMVSALANRKWNEGKS